LVDGDGKWGYDFVAPFPKKVEEKFGNIKNSFYLCSVNSNK